MIPESHLKQNFLSLVFRVSYILYPGFTESSPWFFKYWVQGFLNLVPGYFLNLVSRVSCISLHEYLQTSTNPGTTQSGTQGSSQILQSLVNINSDTTQSVFSCICLTRTQGSSRIPQSISIRIRVSLYSPSRYNSM